MSYPGPNFSAQLNLNLSFDPGYYCNLCWFLCGLRCLCDTGVAFFSEGNLALGIGLYVS